MANTEIKKILENLLAFNTKNSSKFEGGYTLPLLLYVKNRLENVGAKVIIQEYEIVADVGGKKVTLGKRGNLIASLKQGVAKKSILFQGHTDTILDETNFTPKIVDNMAIGRGAVDMKGSVAGMIRAFEILAKTGRDLNFSPILLLTSDEEAFNFSGIKKFLNAPTINTSDIILGICGEPTNLEVKNFLYGAGYFIIETFGSAGHSSQASEDNAIEKSIPVLQSLVEIKKELLNEENHKSVLNIGTIRGGNKVNQIPDKCFIEISIRNAISGRDIEKILAEKLAKKDNQVNIIKQFLHEPVQVNQTKEMRDIMEISFSKSRVGLKYSDMVAFSEATFLNSKNIPTFVFGPGDIALAHTEAKNEKINLDEMEKFSEILVNMCLKR